MARAGVTRRKWIGPWRLDRTVGMWWRPFQKDLKHGRVSLNTIDMVAFSLDGKVRWMYDNQ